MTDEEKPDWKKGVREKEDGEIVKKLDKLGIHLEKGAYFTVHRKSGKEIKTTIDGGIKIDTELIEELIRSTGDQD